MTGMPTIRRNRRATSSAINALHQEERYERIDEGLVGLCRFTADLLDEARDGGQKLYAIAAVGRLHLAATLALLHRFPVEQPDPDDAGSEIVRILQDPRWLTQDATGDEDYRIHGQYPPWDERREAR